MRHHKDCARIGTDRECDCDNRCPTCGRFTGRDPDGYYDTEPGGVDGWDPVVAYCDERCAARKCPPSKRSDGAP